MTKSKSIRHDVTYSVTWGSFDGIILPRFSPVSLLIRIKKFKEAENEKKEKKITIILLSLENEIYLKLEIGSIDTFFLFGIILYERYR